MNFKSSAVALALIAASFAASATDYSLGVISTDANAPTNATFLVGSASFVDYLSFTVGAGSVDASAAPNSLKLNGKKVSSISDLFVTVLDSSKVSTGISFAGNDDTNTFSLAAGNYFLKVTGAPIAGASSASYSVALVSAPVPEPETYALMLAGLGAVGFVARRRKAA